MANAPSSVDTLEALLVAWEGRVVRLEQQVALVSRAAKQLRAAARDGHVAAAAQAGTALRDSTAQLSDMVKDAAEAPEVDIPAAFANGTYLAELSEAAAKAGVTLIQRDGRITMFPVSLSLDARNLGVKVGRRLERRRALRPSHP